MQTRLSDVEKTTTDQTKDSESNPRKGDQDA